MIDPRYWSSPVPLWLLAILVLTLFAAALAIAAGVDAGSSNDVGSWRWPVRPRLG